MPQTINPRVLFLEMSKPSLQCLVLILVVTYLAGQAAIRWADQSVSSIDSSQPVRIAYGQTQGTTYQVWSASPLPIGIEEDLERAIAELLSRVDSHLSTWRDDSEITAFNQLTSTDWMPTSSHLLDVLQIAESISEKTNGAFSVTASRDISLSPPLTSDLQVNLQSKEPENANVVDNALRSRTVHIDRGSNRIRKSVPDVVVDVDGVAQGYTVDLIASLLLERGIDSFLVEVGGELYGHGYKANGDCWAIGIESDAKVERQPHEVHPQPQRGMAPPTQSSMLTESRILLENQAISTSGNKWRSLEGRNPPTLASPSLAHQSRPIIDPASGNVIHNDLASVSVIAKSCAEADGIATALMVMGARNGLIWAESNHIAAHFQVRDGEQIRILTSTAWKRFERVENSDK